MGTSMIKLTFVACMVITAGFAQPQGLQVNDPAPDFAGVDQKGNKVQLAGLLQKGPVVVVFYRGQWCPYCNRQLSALEDSLGLIKEKNATLLAITPEASENISKTVEKTQASYSVLHDEGLKIMNAYKVNFTVEAATVEKLKSYGIDLATANGSNGAQLPVPAVYVIDKNGKIVYRHFDPDYRLRPSVKEIISHL